MGDDNAYLRFDGSRTYIEIPSSADFSIATTGELTVSAWIRPTALVFPRTEGRNGSRYIHWLGKGASGEQEWTFRMYSQDTADGRMNRISFYVFNADGGLGIGSYFQDDLQAGEWFHVVGAVDAQRIAIFRDGVVRDSDRYVGRIVPQAGSAPVRIGTRDLQSFFQGAIGKVRMWNRRLADTEVMALHDTDIVPVDGLVAEYRLAQDIAPDTAGNHPGVIYAPTWLA